MMERLKIGHYLLFFGLINLIQAFFTPIHYDEAYYYQYAQNLDWGYFDHPPMVALCIKIGSIFFSQELGVRFLSIIFGIVSHYLIWLILGKPKNIYLFALLSLSMVMINAYGFIMSPDTPMLMFGTLLLYLYKRFLETPTYILAILIGICAALLLYSKYHGIIFIGLIVISNIKLLINPKFYISILIAGLLFLPHIFWQINNEFPSLSYHLVERSQESTNYITYLLEYLPNQLLVFSPFLFYFFVKAALKSQKGNQFNRALQFIFWGFLGFFFLMCFKGHVEPHWTLLAHVAAFILVFHYIENGNSNLKLIQIFAFITIGLVFTARILILAQVVPKFGFRDMSNWAKEIESIANKKTVVVQDSYKHAAIYNFYTHKPSISLHSAKMRKSQYTIWAKDYNLSGKDIVYVDFSVPKNGVYKEINSLMGKSYISERKMPVGSIPLSL